TVAPATSANPTAGSPITFTANGTSPLGLPLTYQWEFELPGTTGQLCLNNEPCLGYSLSAPVSGAQVSYTFSTGGTFHVRLTATDSFGKQTAEIFTVAVAQGPLGLTLNQNCASNP